MSRVFVACEAALYRRGVIIVGKHKLAAEVNRDQTAQSKLDSRGVQVCGARTA